MVLRQGITVLRCRRCCSLRNTAVIQSLNNNRRILVTSVMQLAGFTFIWPYRRKKNSLQTTISCFSYSIKCKTNIPVSICEHTPIRNPPVICNSPHDLQVWLSQRICGFSLYFQVCSAYAAKRQSQRQPSRTFVRKTIDLFLSI